MAPSKKSQAITGRLIVRRVRDLNNKAPGGPGELFTAWRYHAIFTDSPFVTLQPEEHHRGHAQAEQPSGTPDPAMQGRPHLPGLPSAATAQFAPAVIHDGRCGHRVPL
jgi:hypothetical protein